MMDRDPEEISSQCSYTSVAHSHSSDSSDSYSARLSPRAVDPPEDIDWMSKVIGRDLEAGTNDNHNPTSDGQKEHKTDHTVRQDCNEPQILKPQDNRHIGGLKEQDGQQQQQQQQSRGNNTRTFRWWESQTAESDDASTQPSLSFQPVEQSLLSSQSQVVPPPPALRSSRRLSLPGAFRITGPGGQLVTRRRNGESEEEKYEDEPISSASQISSRPNPLNDLILDDILLEATLVSEKSKDIEMSTNELVQAEPLHRRCTAKGVCFTAAILFFIAFVCVAAGTELGRRRYGTGTTTGTFVATGPGSGRPIVPNTTSKPPMITSNTTGDRAPSEEETAPPDKDSDWYAGDTPPSGASNTSSATISLEDIDLVKAVLPEKTKGFLEDPNSPQAKAFKWLTNDPQLRTYPIDRTLQRFSLATFYFASNGPLWEQSDHWLSYDVPECEWLSDAPAALVCSGDDSKGEYNVLALNQFTLNGSVPEEMWFLSSLVSLAFYEHALTGTISPRVGKMHLLESLALVDIALEGSLPTELGYTKLKALHLGGNSLTSTIPAEIGNIQSLKYLYLNNNLLVGTLPTQLGLLTRLEELALHNNSLETTIPSELGLLSDLKYIYLGFNNLFGSVPAEFNSLTNLRGLIMQSSSLSGSLPSLSNLRSLQYVFMGSNQLTGTISPNVVSSWKSLKVFDIGSNDIAGQIPSELGLLQDIEVLDLFNNSLSGTLPSELGLLSNAQKIMLEMNSIVGTIPTTFGLLTNLKRLWLHDTGLSGLVPLELCSLMELGSLDLSVDCNRVSCDCGCNCRKTTVPEPDYKTESESTSAWDNFVDFVANLFN